MHTMVQEGTTQGTYSDIEGERPMRAPHCMGKESTKLNQLKPPLPTHAAPIMGNPANMYV